MSYSRFIKQNAAPSEAKSIGVYNENDELIGYIPIKRENIKPDYGELRYTFGLVSDCHIRYGSSTSGSYYADQQWHSMAAIKYLQNINADFLVASGDFHDLGSSDTVVRNLKNAIDACGFTMSEVDSNNKFIYAFGNHENNTSADALAIARRFANTYSVGWRPNFFTVSKNGGKDIFAVVHYRAFGNNSTAVGYRPYNFATKDVDDSGNAVPNTEDLADLDTFLSNHNDKRIFIIQHVPAYGVTMSSKFDFVNIGRGGRYNDTSNFFRTGEINKVDDPQYGFYTIVANHFSINNMIWISGHTHMEFDFQDPTINSTMYRTNVASRIDSSGKKFYAVHVPSAGKLKTRVKSVGVDHSSTDPKIIEDGVDKRGEFYVVKVYSNGVLFEGMSISVAGGTAGNYEYLIEHVPIGTFWIDIPEGEVTDG